MFRFPLSQGAAACERAPHLPLNLLAAALLAAAPATQAAEATSAGTVVVTGNPLGRDLLTQPSSTLSGDALTLQRAGTLGDTLAGLPGIAATGFGPQSSRPVIRGLDGDRIRLLDNGGASADASNLSFDHAVAVDPLVVERVEVLRGPAALLYGGNATGGVVNTLDNRIPRYALDGLGGRAELRVGGAADERAGAAVLEGGAKGLNWHVDAASRRSEDLRVPRFTPQRDGQAEAATDRVANSAGDSRAAAVGASWADADGYLGAALDGYRNDYGVTVEPDVTIAMRRERLQLAGERRRLGGPIEQLEFQFSRTRYNHQEIEGDGEVGTTFRSTGQELRLLAHHAPLAGLRGVFGLQSERLDFSALGEEAFVPTTRSRNDALFAIEEWRSGPLQLNAGARLEHAVVRSDGDAADAASSRFGAATERSFTPLNLSLGALLPLAGDWSASATLGRTERAPAYYELFANGLHVATGSYERGDSNLGSERSRHLELGLQWRAGAQQLRADVFVTRFSNYIALDATGRQVDGDGAVSSGSDSAPEYRFSGVPARLYGLELEARSRLLERPWTLDLSGNLDWLHGDNLASGEPLPRLAPLRLKLALEAAQGPWRLGARLRLSAAQNRVPSTDVATPGAALLDLWAGWSQRLGGLDTLWTLKLDNVGNALAYNATAVRTARDLTPAGARALSAGVRVAF